MIEKLKDSPNTDNKTLKDDPKEMPEFEEYEVYEALIDRTRDISPKNDKAQ